MEEKEKSKKEDVKARLVVVDTLPTQSISKVIDENGQEINLMTKDEALAELVETVRQLKKGLL